MLVILCCVYVVSPGHGCGPQSPFLCACCSLPSLHTFISSLPSTFFTSFKTPSSITSTFFFNVILYSYFFHITFFLHSTASSHQPFTIQSYRKPIGNHLTHHQLIVSPKIIWFWAFMRITIRLCVSLDHYSTFACPCRSLWELSLIMILWRMSWSRAHKPASPSPLVTSSRYVSLTIFPLNLA